MIGRGERRFRVTGERPRLASPRVAPCRPPLARSRGWLLAALLLAQACAHASAPKRPAAVGAAPAEVTYQSGLTDPFFGPARYVVPSHFIEIEPGVYENTRTGETLPAAELPKQRQTASLRTDHQLPHTIRFGTARLLANGALALEFDDETPATNDHLELRVRGETFTAAYVSIYPARGKGPAPSWVCLQKSLLLDARDYKAGDTVSGRLELSCEESVDGKAVGTTRIEGPFRLRVE